MDWLSFAIGCGVGFIISLLLFRHFLQRIHKNIAMLIELGRHFERGYLKQEGDWPKEPPPA